MAGRKFRVDVSERDFFRILFGGVGEIVAAGAVEDFDEFFSGIEGFGVSGGEDGWAGPPVWVARKAAMALASTWAFAPWSVRGMWAAGRWDLGSRIHAASQA